MSATVSVIVKGISAIVIELVNQSDTESPKNFYCQRWEKVNPGNRISNAWPYDVSEHSDYDE